MKKIKIAITGGIGSGKSTAISYIRSLGYPVFSCDQIYNEIIKTKVYIDQIAKVFPDAYQNGGINRNILSKIVFSNPEKREILNGISHPLVMRALYKQMSNCKDEYTFAEVPLLFEGNFENEFDYVIVIQRNERIRMEDVKKRSGLSIEDIKKRIDAQFKYDTQEGRDRLKKCKAYIIDNEKDKENLFKELQEVICKIKTQA